MPKLNDIISKIRKDGFYWARLRGCPAKEKFIISYFGTIVITGTSEKLREYDIIWGPKVEPPEF